MSQETKPSTSQSGFFEKQTGARVVPQDGDPAEARGKSRIEKFRAIVRSGEILCIEGHPIDPMSASVVVCVYDALRTPDTRHTLMSFLGVRKVVDIATRAASRPQARKSA